MADAEAARDLSNRGGGGGMQGGGGSVEGGVLHDVKIMSCSTTRYKSNSPKRAVDTKADLLPQECLIALTRPEGLTRLTICSHLHCAQLGLL